MSDNKEHIDSDLPQKTLIDSLILRESDARHILQQTLIDSLKDSQYKQALLADMLDTRQSVISEVLSDNRKLSLSTCVKWSNRLGIDWFNILNLERSKAQYKLNIEQSKANITKSDKKC